MAKKGTTGAKAAAFVDKSRSNYHGPGNKNVVTSGKSTPKPSGPTSPIKGMDKGGV